MWRFRSVKRSLTGDNGVSAARWESQRRRQDAHTGEQDDDDRRTLRGAASHDASEPTDEQDVSQRSAWSPSDDPAKWVQPVRPTFGDRPGPDHAREGFPAVPSAPGSDVGPADHHRLSPTSTRHPANPGTLTSTAARLTRVYGPVTALRADVAAASAADRSAPQATHPCGAFPNATGTPGRTTGHPARFPDKLEQPLGAVEHLAAPSAM